MLTDKELALTPPPPARVGRLDSLKGVRVEMAKIYRQCRQGTLDPADGTRFVFILSAIGKLIEGSTLEERIARLEKLTQQHELTTRRH